MFSEVQDQRHAWAAGVVHETKKVQPKLSQFEQLIQSLGIPEDKIEQLSQCPEVVEWVRANYQTRFCPEHLLAKLGIRITDDLSAPAPAITAQEAAA